MSGAGEVPPEHDIDEAPRRRTGRDAAGGISLDAGGPGRKPTPAKGSRAALPSAARALKARPGYEVGYAKPPEATRFQKGTSGNPRGRPKGRKNLVPALNEERMKAIILEEAYRTITVRDGTRNVTVPIARAVLRSLAVNAVKGQHRSQRLFAELLSAVETSHKALHDEYVQALMGYKFEWDDELERRRAFGITDLPDPVPHPDHIRIDYRTGRVRNVGPWTKEEKARLDDMVAKRAGLVEEIRDLQADLVGETDPVQRASLERDITLNQYLVELITKVERGEPVEAVTATRPPKRR